MDLGSEILGFDDLRTKEVMVKQWKRKVTIRELGLKESMTAYGSLKPSKGGDIELGPEDIAQTVAYGVIDPETGERVFADSDVEVLAKKNNKALMFLYAQITKLSGSVEEEAKN